MPVPSGEQTDLPGVSQEPVCMPAGTGTEGAAGEAAVVAAGEMAEIDVMGERDDSAGEAAVVAAEEMAEMDVMEEGEDSAGEGAP